MKCVKPQISPDEVNILCWYVAHETNMEKCDICICFSAGVHKSAPYHPSCKLLHHKENNPILYSYCENLFQVCITIVCFWCLYPETNW